MIQLKMFAEKDIVTLQTALNEFLVNLQKGKKIEDRRAMPTWYVQMTADKGLIFAMVFYYDETLQAK